MELTDKIVATSLYEGRSHMSKSGRKRWSQCVLWDDGLPGFGLRITSTNRKSFIVSYRAGGRKRTQTLGKVDSLTVDEARQLAAEILTSHAAEPRGAAGQAPLEGVETVAQLAQAYLEGHLKTHVPSWFADQRLIRTHINPAMGRSPLAELSPTDLTNLQARVARRFPADARRLKTLLGGMTDWAAEHGLWPRSSRQDGSAATGPAPEAEPEPTPLPSAEELRQSLRQSEERRRELAARLDEVSSSGAEMLAQINQQAVAQKELADELASSRRQLEQALRAAADRPDPEKTEKQTANLRLSVEQLMESLRQAKVEQRETAERIAAAEARASTQTKKVAALARLRNELESRALEQEREAAIRKVQQRGGGRRRFAWLAAGVIGGVLATLLLQRVFGPDEVASPRSAEDPANAAMPAAASSGNPSLPQVEPAAAAEVAAAAASPADDDRFSAGGGKPRPDPAAAEAAVHSWATAWSEQRVADYLAAYSKEFVPPGGLRRAEWAYQRQNRILRPASIRIEVGAMSPARLADDRVRVSFEQSYETPSYADRVRKTLELIWEDGSWKIVAEKAG